FSNTDLSPQLSTKSAPYGKSVPSWFLSAPKCPHCNRSTGYLTRSRIPGKLRDGAIVPRIAADQLGRAIRIHPEAGWQKNYSGCHSYRSGGDRAAQSAG